MWLACQNYQIQQFVVLSLEKLNGEITHQETKSLTPIQRKVISDIEQMENDPF